VESLRRANFHRPCSLLMMCEHSPPTDRSVSALQILTKMNSVVSGTSGILLLTTSSHWVLTIQYWKTTPRYSTSSYPYEKRRRRYLANNWSRRILRIVFKAEISFKSLKDVITYLDGKALFTCRSFKWPNLFISGPV
jgi:hypothetical protein